MIALFHVLFTSTNTPHVHFVDSSNDDRFTRRRFSRAASRSDTSYIAARFDSRPDQGDGGAVGSRAVQGDDKRTHAVR